MQLKKEQKLPGGELIKPPPQKLYPQGFAGAPQMFAGAGGAVGGDAGGAVGGGGGGGVGGAGAGAATGRAVGAAVGSSVGTAVGVSVVSGGTVCT